MSQAMGLDARRLVRRTPAVLIVSALFFVLHVSDIPAREFDRSVSLNDLMAVPPRTFITKRVRRLKVGNAIFEKSGEAVCSDDADLAIDPNPVREILLKSDNILTFEALRKRSYLAVTKPAVDQRQKNAVYYVVSILLNVCRTSDRCDVEIKSARKVAPVEGNTVLASAAKDTDDVLTDQLVDGAKKSIIEATVWCRLKTTFKTIKGIEY